MLRNGRYRNWVFTLNNPYYSLTPEIDCVGSPVSFMAWQLEIGAEGTEHYQGYIELDRPCSLLQMHQLGGAMLLGAHFEVCIFGALLFLGHVHVCRRLLVLQVCCDGFLPVAPQVPDLHADFRDGLDEFCCVFVCVFERV